MYIYIYIYYIVISFILNSWTIRVVKMIDIIVIIGSSILRLLKKILTFICLVIKFTLS